MFLYHRAPWLERLTGIQFIWIAEPVQLWLPGLPTYFIEHPDGRVTWPEGS